MRCCVTPDSAQSWKGKYEDPDWSRLAGAVRDEFLWFEIWHLSSTHVSFFVAGHRYWLCYQHYYVLKQQGPYGAYGQSPWGQRACQLTQWRLHLGLQLEWFQSILRNGIATVQWRKDCCCRDDRKGWIVRAHITVTISHNLYIYNDMIWCNMWDLILGFVWLWSYFPIYIYIETLPFVLSIASWICFCRGSRSARCIYRNRPKSCQPSRMMACVKATPLQIFSSGPLAWWVFIVLMYFHTRLDYP